MNKLLQRIPPALARFSVVPVDHYTALGIDRGASDAQIEAAYADALERVTRSPWSKAEARICGRSPANLRTARDELLNPTERLSYDRYLDTIAILFSFPPQ